VSANRKKASSKQAKSRRFDEYRERDSPFIWAIFAKMVPA